MNIPFADVQAQYASIKDEMDAAIAAVLRDAAFIGGPYVRQFEDDFAAYCGVRHAVGCSNGTDAIRLALLACGIGPGDEVITTPSSFIATTEAISMVGASIRFVDIDPDTALMSAEALAAAVTSRTRAVIPVHLYGQPCDMDAILAVAARHGLRVVSDAAQAHGALDRGRPVGTLGDAVTFSFYPGKNLGAYGDAGAVVTQDPGIARMVSMLRDHGRTQKYAHDIEGFNCRLDGLQAAVLSVKLRHLAAWTESRRAHARRYREQLAGIPGIELIRERSDARAVYHLLVLRTAHRDALQAALGAMGIATGIHYPIPLHLQKAYAHLGLPEGSFPVTERHCREALSLPLFPEMTSAQIDTVADAVTKIVSAD